MNYSTVTNTLYNNLEGIIDPVYVYGLQDKIKHNTKLYIYKYDFTDLVEISYYNSLVVYNFNHNKGRSDFIKDNMDFYTGYFDSAGFKEKRFLFDLSTRLPVSYVDFEYKEKPDLGNEFTAFITKMDSGYITEKKTVNVFSSYERTKYLDSCVFSIFNNSFEIKKPANLKLAGCLGSAVISGLLNDIKYGSITNQLDLSDAEYKFLESLSGTDFDSSYITTAKSKLITSKFERIIKNQEKVIDGTVIEKSAKGEVALSNIISVGLDKFTKVIDNDKEMILVDVDCAVDKIKAAYIMNGTMFICPVNPETSIHYFEELVSSENVEFVIYQ